jgi:HSP20 family protein
MALLATRQNGRLAWRSPFSDFLGLGFDVAKTENGYTVEMPVAGFKPEQIDVTLEQNVLTVSAKSEKRQFTRSLLVPDDIDGDAIQANVADGLLTLQLSFHPKAQPKKINVSY